MHSVVAKAALIIPKSGIVPVRTLSSTSFMMFRHRSLKSNTVGMHELMIGPEYEFADGKPTPLRYGQRGRIRRMERLVEQVKQCISEVDFAKERYDELKAKEENEINTIIRKRFAKKT